MKRLIIIAGVALFCSCQGKPGTEKETPVDTVATASPVVKDTVRANIGTWRAKTQLGKAGRGGMLTVTGIVNTGDLKTKAKLSKRLPINATSNELVLVLSKEPKEGKGSKVSFTEDLRDIKKYQKVIILYNNKQVAAINNIEQVK